MTMAESLRYEVGTEGVDFVRHPERDCLLYSESGVEKVLEALESTDWGLLILDDGEDAFQFVTRNRKYVTDENVIGKDAFGFCSELEGMYYQTTDIMIDVGNTFFYWSPIMSGLRRMYYSFGKPDYCISRVTPSDDGKFFPIRLAK